MEPNSSSCELSVVMPCLNEKDTLGVCIDKILQVFAEHLIDGEVIVADNGSTDGSVEIAQAKGVRVVRVVERGYGCALMGGIAEARGRFVLMGDADDSYDFLEIPKFLVKLRENYDLVQGCRLPQGGGTIAPGAMPWSHRWLGNPLFSFLARHWFRAPIHDIYCGMRGFTKTLYERLNLRCTGMEFATEMIIKSSLYLENITEVPITLHKDGRIAHPPHLKTMRDGWRTLRFFLLYSPRWLFLVPGVLLITLGLIGAALALPGIKLGIVTFDAHSLLFSSLAMLCGYQAVLFAVFTKTFAMNEGLVPEDPRMMRAFQIITMETGVVAGILSSLVGAGLLMYAVTYWWKSGFGRLDYAQTMRWVIPGVTLAALGFQTVLSSFFISVLGMHRK
jgi:glycosyltransferase involved in cell wall biosynthesis